MDSPAEISSISSASSRSASPSLVADNSPFSSSVDPLTPYTSRMSSVASASNSTVPAGSTTATATTTATAPSAAVSSASAASAASRKRSLSAASEHVHAHAFPSVMPLAADDADVDVCLLPPDEKKARASTGSAHNGSRVKKPLNAYNVFFKQEFEAMKVAHSDKNLFEICKLMGIKWRELPQDLKQRFAAEAADLNQLHGNNNNNNGTPDALVLSAAASSVTPTASTTSSGVRVVPLLHARSPSCSSVLSVPMTPNTPALSTHQGSSSSIAGSAAGSASANKKKPLNAYNRFQRLFYVDYKKTHLQCSISDMSTAAAAAWKAMSSEEKHRYSLIRLPDEEDYATWLESAGVNTTSAPSVAATAATATTTERSSTPNTVHSDSSSSAACDGSLTAPRVAALASQLSANDQAMSEEEWLRHVRSMISLSTCTYQPLPPPVALMQSASFCPFMAHEDAMLAYYPWYF